MVIVLLLLSLFRTFKSGNLTCQLNMQSTRTVVTSREQDVQPRVPAIAIKLPPFWPSDPNIWFMRVEAQFTTQGIITRGQCSSTSWHHYPLTQQLKFGSDLLQTHLHTKLKESMKHLRATPAEVTLYECIDLHTNMHICIPTA